MPTSRFGALFLATIVLLTACTPPSPPPPTPRPELTPTPAPPAQPSALTATPRPTAIPAPTEPPIGGPSRDLTFGVRYELTGLSDQLALGVTADSTQRLFNASIAMIDSRGQALPYLAESLPELNTDSWKIFADGQMETTYRLKPNLTWHDGRPLTSQDFAFALLVYTTPALVAMFEPTLQKKVIAVSSPEPRTVVLRWDSLYPGAGTLHAREFSPLPRHLLESTWILLFANVAPIFDATERFMGLPYWTQEYVGAGPYRLESWEPGSHLEAVAFDGHALGRPRIDRITVRFTTNENTALNWLLNEDVHIASDSALRFEQGELLKRDWGPDAKGVVLLDPVQPRIITFQFRPEYANPRSLLDVRVRRALASAVDRQALVDALFGGQIPVSDQIMPRNVPYFAELDRVVRKHPYDLRQTEQLMSEAGYSKGGDGVYANSEGQRFAFASWVLSGTQNEKQGVALASGWRQAGFEVQERVVPASQALDGETRATFPGLSSVATASGERALAALAGQGVPMPTSRWRGANRRGWVNQSYDRLWDLFNATLDRNGRNGQIVQLMEVATDDVAAIFLFHNPMVTAHLAGLRGPELGPPDALVNWNIHRWEFH